MTSKGYNKDKHLRENSGFMSGQEWYERYRDVLNEEAAKKAAGLPNEQ